MFADHERVYRACVYTCSNEDGCNGSSMPSLSGTVLLAVGLVVWRTLSLSWFILILNQPGNRGKSLWAVLFVVFHRRKTFPDWTSLFEDVKSLHVLTLNLWLTEKVAFVIFYPRGYSIFLFVLFRTRKFYFATLTIYSCSIGNLNLYIPNYLSLDRFTTTIKL